MTKRIFNSIFCISIGASLLSAVLILGILYSYFSSILISQLKTDTAYIKEGYLQNGISYFESVKYQGNRITLIAEDGTVTYDSDVDLAELDNHNDREEVKEARELLAGQSTRYSNSMSMQNIYYAVRLTDGDILRVSVKHDSVLALIFSLLRPVIIILVLVLILSFWVASRTSKKLIKPINELNLDNPDNNKAYDELAPLLLKIAYQRDSIKAQIAEQKQKQKEFSAITENMREGFIVIDRKAEILSYNSAAARLLKILESDSKQNLLSFNRSEVFRYSVENALKGEYTEQKAAIEQGVYSIIASPVLTKGNVAGAVFIISEITERENREALRREFSANVSHELKTPLTSISGYAEIMKNGIVKKEDVPDFAEKIYNQAQRLIALINDIIKISELDENKSTEERAYIDLYGLAGQIISDFTDLCKERGITTELYGERTVIEGVPHILHEMLYNLYDNAIKYNKDNGTIKVTVKDKCITVTDTGVGIPDADKERVFERFYRVDKGRKTGSGVAGTGLGLSIVKHAAQFHGARIELRSDYGVGTEVKVIFK